jgi:hypothetical protein
LGRVALLGIISFEHLGHTGAAAANISGYDSTCRIFLVELPMDHQPSLSLSRSRTIVPARDVPRGDKVPLRPGLSGFSVGRTDFVGIRLSRRPPRDVDIALAVNPEISTPRGVTRRYRHAP